MDPETGEITGMHFGFQFPVNAIRFQGDIIAAEALTGCVKRASDLTPLIDGLGVPAGLAASGDNLWVGDYETGVIWKAVEDGERLDPPVIVAEGLSKPEGMAVDHDGTLLVMETGNQRLVRVDPLTGNISVIAENLAIGGPGTAGAAPTWAALSGVAVSESGVIYATGDLGNCIYKIRKTGRD